MPKQANCLLSSGHIIRDAVSEQSQGIGNLSPFSPDAVWAAAAYVGDIERILEFWAEDASNYFPGQPPAIGKSAIIWSCGRRATMTTGGVRWRPVLSSVRDGGTRGTWQLASAAPAASIHALLSVIKRAVDSRSSSGEIDTNGKTACTANAATLRSRRQAIPIAKRQCSA